MLVIVDIDGTLAIRGGRGPFEWDLADLDAPNHVVVEVVRALSIVGHEIAFISGREERIRNVTEAWLNNHVRVAGPLFLRRSGDTRPDRQVKEEIFERELLSRSETFLVLDDRDQVVEMWRSRPGVICFQVAEGKF